MPFCRVAGRDGHCRPSVHTGRVDRRQRQSRSQSSRLCLGPASARTLYWAVRFEDAAKSIMLAGEYRPLVDYDTLGKDAALSIPTPDHYLPLLYVLAARQSNENIRFPVEGVDGGSISMLSVQIG